MLKRTLLPASAKALYSLACSSKASFEGGMYSYLSFRLSETLSRAAKNAAFKPLRFAYAIVFLAAFFIPILFLDYLFYSSCELILKLCSVFKVLALNTHVELDLRLCS